MKKPFYLQTWFIVLLAAAWILIVPPIAAVVLLIKQILWDRNLYNKYSAIEDANKYKEETEQACKRQIEETAKKRDDISKNVEDLKDEKAALLKELDKLSSEILINTTVIPVDDKITSEEYKSKYNISVLNEKEYIKSGNAINIHYVSNAPKKTLNNNIKQLLRCFNSEVASAISSISIKNIDSVKGKILKTFETLNKIFETDQISLDKQLLEIKLEQADLMFKYEYQKEQERLQQKAIREQMVEEEKVRREIEKEKAKIEKEENQFKNEITKLMSYMQKSNEAEKQLYIDKIHELEAKLKQVEADKKDVLNREQNTRAGYVYVISNIGSFGEDVYKIGMTRRLEPMDRVKELGDASVPFEFDVHAMIFSDDAPALETVLHNTFRDNQVNKVNPRKEFFRVKLSEIEKVVKENFNATVTFTKVAEAAQYRESLKLEQAVSV